MEDPPLFTRYQIVDQLLANQKLLLDEIDAIDGNELLNTNPDTLADFFVEKFTASVPFLKEDKIEVSQDEIRVPLQGRISRAPVTMAGTEYRYHIPYEGDENLFSCRPSTYGSPPFAIVTSEELIVHIRVFPDLPATTALPVSAQFDSQLNVIRGYLETLKRDVAGYNGSLRSHAAGRIAARRQKLLADRHQVASLGYPIRQRPGSSTYAMPAARRKAAIRRPSGGNVPFTPEPALDLAEYEHILSVMANVGRAFELSPSAFAGMNEEDLRMHFLVQLNGWYEGHATGETFNLAGRTDIIIREKDRNVFIAECKFWKGPQGVADAIDQLLGYTSWRDTKTAILIFNRDRHLSTVLEKIPAIIESHPSHIRTIQYPSETGFRFALRHRDDPGRELILTILVFEVPV